MPRDLIQDVSWPGVLRVESCQYTASHGISPGTAVLVKAPQGDDTQAAAFGDLIITDGFHTPIKLEDCHAFDIHGSYDVTGITYTLMIHDRRWRLRNQWGGFGAMRGRFNRSDARGKLVPWGIRSPVELARRCMREMGQANNLVILPDGIPQAAGTNVDKYLRLGENFPQTKTNPYIEADYTPPCDILAQLADSFGCRVVYQPIASRLCVLPQGQGRWNLPDYPYEMISPNVTDPETPVSVGVYGAQIKWQLRFVLEPVGKEWDGSWVPIDMLSYAPTGVGARPQISTVDSTDAPAGAITVRVFGYLEWGDNIVYLDSTGATATAVMGDIYAQLATVTAVTDAFTITLPGTVLTVEAKSNDTEFVLSLTTTWTAAMPPDPPADLENWFAVALVQKNSKGGTNWENEKPGIFSGVRATDRLSYSEARALAVEHIWKTYRVVLADPHTRKPPLTVPLVGKIKRIQQFVFTPDKVEQVVPQPRIAGGINRGNIAGFGVGAEGGILPDFYNGRSRNQPSTVTGSVWKRIGTVAWWIPGFGGSADDNTKPTDRVWVGHSLTFDEGTGDQLVTFGEYVYAYRSEGNTAGFVRKPELTLETGCFILDEDDDQFIRYERELAIPGGVAPTQWYGHQDLQVGIVVKYREPDTELKTIGTMANGEGEAIEVPDPTTMHLQIGWQYAKGDEEFVTVAANDYLVGHARKYVVTGGETRQYIGIIPIDPDGVIQQVTWSIGPAGPTTVVSTNSEHSPVILPYPARRRDELLAPNKAAAAVNKAERATLDPKPMSKP